MEYLLIKVKSLKNKTYQKIMYRLINIYKTECSFNEGALGFNDLLTIYNLFYFLEIETYELEGDDLC